MKAILIIMLFLMGSNYTTHKEPVVIKDVDRLMHEQRKPIFILLTTDWCKYCEMQKNQLDKYTDFLDQSDHFYYVVFNAEQKDSIVFHDQLFQYKSAGLSSGVHELAIALNGSEHIAFPTWVVLDKDYQVVFRENGVIHPKQLKKISTLLNNINE